MSLREQLRMHPAPLMIDVGVVALLALSVFCLWEPTLATRFYQDDYWILFLSQNPSLGLIPGVFPSAQDWRPLGMFGPFYVIRRLFGLDPFIFHLTNVAVHLLNGILVYRLALAMMRTREFALMAAVFYSLHLVHTRSMQWAAGIDNLLSAAWYMLAFLMYVRFREHGQRQAYWGSLIAFSAALLTKEWSVTLVPALLWYELVGASGAPAHWQRRPHVRWKAIGIPIAGYCVPLFAYLAVRILLYTLPREGQYGLTLNTALVIGNLAEYLRVAAFPATAFEPRLGSMPSSLLVTAFLLFLLLSSIFRWPLVTFGLGWFVITLTPVLFMLRRHPYFLAIPLVGCALAVGALAKIAVHRLLPVALKRWASLSLVSALVGIMLVRGVPEVRHQQEAPWLVRSQHFAECTLAYLSSRWPSLPPHSLVSFLGFHPEERDLLGLGSAVNAHYNDNTIRTAFIPQTGHHSSFADTTAASSSLEERIIPRDLVAAFCENASSPRRQ